MILDGKKISTQIKDEVSLEVRSLNDKGITVCLAVVIVGNDSASKIYVKNKKKACETTGILSVSHELPESTTQEELLALIDQLNNDKSINGILVQQPLPKHINETEINNSILPEKDVDCFHPFNTGLVSMGNPRLLPCTPAGVIELIKRYNIDIQGKICVVVGRSNIVGKPMALLLLSENGTVTVCHSKTKGLSDICKNADILVVAMRQPGFITKDMVKPGAVVIDVGIHRDENGKVMGDVANECAEVAGFITPVPGGVGPMTIAMLMKNCVTACKLQNGVS